MQLQLPVKRLPRHSYEISSSTYVEQLKSEACLYQIPFIVRFLKLYRTSNGPSTGIIGMEILQICSVYEVPVKTVSTTNRMHAMMTPYPLPLVLFRNSPFTKYGPKKSMPTNQNGGLGFILSMGYGLIMCITSLSNFNLHLTQLNMISLTNFLILIIQKRDLILEIVADIPRCPSCWCSLNVIKYSVLIG